MKEKEKEKEKEIKISDSELKQIKELTRRRDGLAAQLGASQYEYQVLKNNIVSLISKISEEQNVLGSMLIKNAGLDPDKDKFSIDIETGVITKE